MSNTDFQLFLLPLLESLCDGEAHSPSYVEEELSRYADYSDEQYSTFKGGSNNPVFLHALATATEHLVRAGLIQPQTDGQYKITSLGKMVLNKRLNRIDVAFLKQMPGYDRQ